jgi:phage terminase large subunit
MTTKRVLLPFTPRPWQTPLIQDESKRIVAVVHRRAGKSTGLMWRGIMRGLSITRRDPPPRVIHTLPTQVQWSKTGMWDALARAAAGIPGAMAYKSDGKLVLPNSAVYQTGGMDKPDSWRGGYADEVILDEYDDTLAEGQTPAILPMLADYKGVLVQSGTPKGFGRLKAAYERAKSTPGQSAYLLKWQDTGALDPAEVEIMRGEMTPEEFAQELECSFDAPNSGAYFSRELQAAENDGRIGDVPYNPALPVWTAWDLGMGDSTAIWFLQVMPGGALHWIDYYEGGGLGLDSYAGELASKRYLYWKHLLPHDVSVRELGTGRSRMQTLMGLGIRPIKVVRRMNPIERISALRLLLPRSRFDRARCAAGLKSLWHYRREWHAAAEQFRPNPVHDWSSHAADAAGHMAIGLEETAAPVRKAAPQSPIEFAGSTSWMGL